MNTSTCSGLLMVGLLVAAGAQADPGRCGYAPPPGRTSSPHSSRGWASPPPHGARAPAYGRCAPAPYACAPAGYWTWRQERCWVSGRWVPQVSPCTGTRSVWQAPHYETRWVQVWISVRG